MKKYTLAGKKRTVVGKKTKELRKLGELPATIYGKGLTSQSIVVTKDAFTLVYKQAGETGLIELMVDGEKHHVLVHTLQIDPVSDAPLHIEFHQVDLKEKVHAKVPLQIVGESPVVAQKLGVLLMVHDEVEVEALPTDLPEHIVVDISGLVEVNQECTVAHLSVPAGVTVLADAELTLVKVGPLVTKEAEAQEAAEKAEAAEASAATDAAAPAAVSPEAAEKTPPPEK